MIKLGDIDKGGTDELKLLDGGWVYFMLVESRVHLDALVVCCVALGVGQLLLRCYLGAGGAHYCCYEWLAVRRQD